MSAPAPDTQRPELEALATDGVVVLPGLLALPEIGVIRQALAP